jgi:hypothetical protein
VIRDTVKRYRAAEGWLAYRSPAREARLPREKRHRVGGWAFEQARAPDAAFAAEAGKDVEA